MLIVLQRQAFYNTAESTEVVFGRGSAPDPAGGAHDSRRLSCLGPIWPSLTLQSSSASEYEYEYEQVSNQIKFICHKFSTQYNNEFALCLAGQTGDNFALMSAHVCVPSNLAKGRIAHLLSLTAVNIFVQSLPLELT